MYNIDEIMDMLDWNQPEEVQRRGRELARNIKCFHVFLQPGYPQYNKNVWDNCASIIAERTDEELRPYISSLLEWLEDMNWPGAFCIRDRLKRYEDKEWLNQMLLYSMRDAKALKRRGWLDNLREFQGTDTLTECENASTNERFARRVYEGLVEGFVNIDREKYGTNYVFHGMPEPQRKAIELYNALNEEQKDVFLSVLRQVRTDMVRSMFSIMEGQAGEWINLDFETELKINGKSTDDELTSTYGRMIREMNLDQKVVHGEMNFDMSPIPVSTQ